MKIDTNHQGTKAQSDIDIKEQVTSLFFGAFVVNFRTPSK